MNKGIKVFLSMVVCFCLCGCSSIVSFTAEAPARPEKANYDVPGIFTVSEVREKAEYVEEPTRVGPVVADSMVTASEQYAEVKYAEELAAKEKAAKSGSYVSRPMTKEEEIGNGAPYGDPKAYLNDGSPFSNRLKYYVCGSCNGLFSTYQERNYHMDNTCPIIIQQNEETARYRQELANATVWKCPYCKLDCGSANSGGGESVYKQHLTENHLGQVNYYYWGLGGEYGYYRRVWNGQGWDEVEITKEEYDNR